MTLIDALEDAQVRGFAARGLARKLGMTIHGRPITAGISAYIVDTIVLLAYEDAEDRAQPAND
jgi:hypothetical protein